MTLDVRSPIHGDSLADVLERILDKGIVVAGDVSISLVGIELLTIKLRLLIATVDKARELGINWWESDPNLTVHAKVLEDENADLARRLAGMERQIATLAAEKVTNP